MTFSKMVEHSIASTRSIGSMEARSIRVRELTPVHKRMAVQTLDACIFFIPKLRLELDHLAMARKGYTFIGSGAESEVFSDNHTVLKYVHGSDRLGSDGRQALQQRKQTEFDTVREHMPNFLLDQDIKVAPHMARKALEVVQTRQPHVLYSRVLEVQGSKGNIALMTDESRILDGLSDFVDSAWRLHGASGLLPDTNGTDNIVASEQGVILLDTQPITVQQQDVYQLVQRQLASVTAALDKIS